MRKRLSSLPSPSMAVAFIALLAALGGTAVALPGKNKIDGNDIKKNAVNSADIKNNSVTGKDIRNGRVGSADIKNNSVTGTDINEATLGKVASAGTADAAGRAGSAAAVDSVKGAGVVVVGTSAVGVDEGSGRSAATPVPLVSFGPLSLYGKCFGNEAGPDPTRVHAEIFIRTTVAGGVLGTYNDDDIEGDPFLDPDTPEDERSVNSVTVGPNDANNEAYGDFNAVVPGGPSIGGHTAAHVKQGDLGNNGIYGPGDKCVFQANVIGR